MKHVLSQPLTVVLLALFMTLGACAAPVAAPTPDAAAAPVITCPQADAATQALVHPNQGYCLLYPADFEVVDYPEAASTGIWAPAATSGHRERLFIRVETAAGQTADQVAAALVADLAAAGLSVDDAVRIPVGDPAHGVEAMQLDKLPGQDLNRRVLIVQEERLFDLMFIPVDPEQAEAYAEMETLYAQVMASFTILPTGAAD